MIAYNIEEQKFINTVDGGIATHEEIKDHYDRILREHKVQDCTPKEWDHCRVEKMGCAGCYYDHGIHLLTAEEKPLNFHPLMKKPKLPPIPKVNLKYDGELKIPEIADRAKCLHCNGDNPVYCEPCYQLLINRITCLEAITEHTSFPRNTVLEFMDALRNIIISGEKDEIKLNKIMSTIIFYERDLK